MGIVATDPSGLADTTTYYFKVNGTEYDITTGASPTYEDVANLIDVAISGAGFGAKIVPADDGEDIRLYNDAVRGSGSSAVLAQGDSSPDLFTSFNFWSRFRKPMVKALEDSGDSYELEREGSGGASASGSVDIDERGYVYNVAGSATLSGTAETEYIEYVPTEGTAFFGDTYYQDEYYGDKG